MKKISFERIEKKILSYFKNFILKNKYFDFEENFLKLYIAITYSIILDLEESVNLLLRLCCCVYVVTELTLPLRRCLR